MVSHLAFSAEKLRDVYSLDGYLKCCLRLRKINPCRIAQTLRPRHGFWSPEMYSVREESGEWMNG